jgi:trehalose 6-phosphate phosphatase
MALPSPSSEAGTAGLHAILTRPQDALLAFDFDGVLSPIVADPDQSRPYPGVVAALERLVDLVGSIGIVTGREVGVVLRLGNLDRLTRNPRFFVHGLYGLQWWDSASQTVAAEATAPGVAAVRAALPALIQRLAVSPGVAIEDKGMSVAVHTRRAADPQGAFTALREPLSALARAHGLALEPGRLVLELRPPGMNKGNVLTDLVGRRGAKAVAYFGDDLGDLAAFDAVEKLRTTGVPGLKVCSGSDEVELLAARADLIVDGPPGVLRFLDTLVDALVDL